MKQIIRFFSASIVMIAFSVSAVAQGVTASATASATIISPLSISNTANMVLGNIAVGTGGGTLVLATNGTRTATGDVSFQAVPAGVAAAFTVTGGATLTYTISIPNVTLTSGGNNMTLDTFVTNPVSPATASGGADPLLVGGTLHVGASQPTGAYSGTINVTVAYN